MLTCCVYKGGDPMKWIKRILGCVGIAVVSTLFVDGCVSLILKFWYNAEPSLLFFPVLFVLKLMCLLACLLLYCVNTSLWDSVYKAQEIGNSSILCLLPNIKVVVELIDYIGHVNNNKDERC